MNFFEHQDKARKNTTLLVLYFSVAVILIILAVNVVLYGAFLYLTYSNDPGVFIRPTDWITSEAALITTLVTISIIGGGSLLTFFQLLGGGESLASMVNAREVEGNSKDLKEQQLVNVVEEMAIASGTPRPRIYVMDHEQGLNAFVAGYEPTETILVVTRGLLDKMNRDQLQGVVGHEFSHIFNGDMRINIRLISILAGILTIGKLGQFLMRFDVNSSRSRNRSAGGSMPAIILGLGLVIIGYVGLFFGRLIKAAVSRQREFLADASSVQYTRNPSSIAEALLTIKNNITGSLLYSSHSEDISHMCFGQSIKMKMSGLLATHPPLDERISAIDKRYLAIDRVRNRQAKESETATSAQGNEIPAGVAGFAGAASSVTETIKTDPKALISSIGQPQPAHLEYAHSLYEAIDTRIKASLHTVDGAKAAAYALVIANGETAPAWKELKQHEERAILEKTRDLVPLVAKAGTRLRIPIADLAIPSLKKLEQQERDQFLETLQKLILADRKYSLFEFSLYSVFSKHLDSKANRNHRVAYKSFKPVMIEVNLLISMLTHASGMAKNESRELHHKIIKTFTDEEMQQQPAHSCTAGQLAKTLEKLNLLTPLLKRPLLAACADAILDDNKIQVQEAELIRAISESIDCPMPPLLNAS